MYCPLKAWSEIRRRVLVEGLSRRQILRATKMHWLTLKNILEHRESPATGKPSNLKSVQAFFLGVYGFL